MQESIDERRAAVERAEQRLKLVQRKRDSFVPDDTDPRNNTRARELEDLVRQAQTDLAWAPKPKRIVDQQPKKEH